MQALLGTRTAADVNLAAQIVLLAGLLAGFYLARHKRFDQHANVQTAMVLLNLFFIAFVMVTSFYAYVIAGGTTTGRVAQLMIVHGLLGILVQGFALYLVLRMRTQVIPKQFRIGNIRTAMRATLAAWTVLVLLGVGIYVERYLNQRAVASAPLSELRQLGADLYVHAVELEDASVRGSDAAIKRHSEHLINLIEGKESRFYGDNDVNGHVEDPGDGVGLRARLETVAATSDDPSDIAEADTVRGQLDRIVDLATGLLGGPGLEAREAPVTEILDLSQQVNGEGVFEIDRRAREAGVVQAPSLVIADVAGGPGRVTVSEDQFLFIPSAITIPAGTIVTWTNDEQAKHTATADDGLFDSGDQNLGDSFSYTFAEPGAYPYFCRYHGDVDGIGMSGVVLVE